MYCFLQTVSFCDFVNYQSMRCRECSSEHAANNNLYWLSNSLLDETMFTLCLRRCLCNRLYTFPFLFYPAAAIALAIEESSFGLFFFFFNDNFGVLYCFLWIKWVSFMYAPFCEDESWVYACANNFKRWKIFTMEKLNYSSDY